jgi:hypothetical protein
VAELEEAASQHGATIKADMLDGLHFEVESPANIPEAERISEGTDEWHALVTNSRTLMDEVPELWL